MADLLDQEINEFALDFEEPLEEGIFNFKPKQMNHEEFKILLHKEGSLPVYYKKEKGILNVPSVSYCALVCTQLGIPVMYLITFQPGYHKHDEIHLGNRTNGTVVFSCRTFDQLWNYILETTSKLPDNYAPAYTFIN